MAVARPSSTPTSPRPGLQRRMRILDGPVVKAAQGDRRHHARRPGPVGSAAVERPRRRGLVQGGLPRSPSNRARPRRALPGIRCRRRPQPQCLLRLGLVLGGQSRRPRGGVHYWASGAAEGRSAGPRFDTAYYIAQNPEVGAESINPLLHYLQFGQFEGRTAVPYDDAEAFEVGVRAKQLAMTGPASALFRGVRGDHVHFPLLARAEPGEAGALPLPPLRLAQRIGSVTLGDFEESGKAIRDTIVRALPEGFTWAGSRCLDFGSGVGRALRHFRAEAQQAEFWGCVIDGRSIRWSVQHLSPPVRFFQISEVPTKATASISSMRSPS